MELPETPPLPPQNNRRKTREAVVEQQDELLQLVVSNNDAKPKRAKVEDKDDYASDGSTDSRHDFSSTLEPETREFLDAMTEFGLDIPNLYKLYPEIFGLENSLFKFNEDGIIHYINVGTFQSARSQFYPFTRR